MSDEVFAGFGVDHELLGLRAAHGSGIGLDGDELEAAASEDAAVDAIVGVVAHVQPGFVDIKGVAVFHEELADAQETGFGPWFVAELGLDLVPDLGELLVGAELVAGDGGHDLFVGHAEGEFCAFAVLEAKHVVAHAGPAAGLFPELARVEGGQQELLADGVHLFADDGDDLVDGAIAKEEVGVDAGAELTDVAGAQEQLVACDFGVGGCFTEGGDEEFGPAMHASCCLSARELLGDGARFHSNCVVVGLFVAGAWAEPREQLSWSDARGLFEGRGGRGLG